MKRIEVVAAIIRREGKVFATQCDVLLTAEQVPKLIRTNCGGRNSERINAFMLDLVENSRDGELKMSPKMQETFNFFHSFMYSDVYTNPIAKSEENKVEGILGRLYDYYIAHPEKLPEDFQPIVERDGRGRAACDYISGMTDGYAMEKYGELFIPFAWSVK